MKVLAVYCHPRRDSYCRAVLEAFEAGATAAGHVIDVLDLHAERFAFEFQPGDFAQFAGGPMPADVQAQQRRVEAADALVFVYPIYWWTFPAPLRGWIDRVFSQGWAYRITDDAQKALLRDRPTRVFATAGVSADTFASFGYAAGMRALIDDGLFRYCGLRNLRTHYVFSVHDSAESRARGLADAERCGRTLGEPAGSA